MPVIVNGYEFSDAEMAAELPNHHDSAEPLKTAMTALVLRHLLITQAEQLQVQGASDEAKIEALLAQQVNTPIPCAEECARYYQAHPSRFTVGELVEASHILFQVTDSLNLDQLRAHAQTVLAQALENPSQFAHYAKANSNCPSSEVGGNLGQLSRGETVPEFEKFVFTTPAHSIYPKLIETRFGLHILQIGRKEAGQLLPLEQVQNRISEALQQTSLAHATRQYLQLLVGQAEISGIDLSGADNPLVQ